MATVTVSVFYTDMIVDFWG